MTIKKKYHRKSPDENIWILLPSGAPPQAMLSRLPKGSKIISVTLPPKEPRPNPELTKEDNNE